MVFTRTQLLTMLAQYDEDVFVVIHEYDSVPRSLADWQKLGYEVHPRFAYASETKLNFDFKD